MTNRKMHDDLRCSIDVGRLSYLGSGAYSDVFALSGGKRVLKLSYYSDPLLKSMAAAMRRGDNKAAVAKFETDPITVSNKLGKITNHLIHEKRSPHFVRTYGSKNCRGFYGRVQSLIPKRQVSAYQARYNNISLQDFYASNLTEYLQKTPNIGDFQLMSIVFQVIYTLSVLQRTIKNFRHNDLSTNNVLVEKYQPKPQATYQYIIDNTKYYIPDFGLRVAIGDFDFAHGGRVSTRDASINELSIQNEKVLSGQFVDKYHISTAAHPSYDVYFFLATMYNVMLGTPHYMGCPLTMKFLIHTLKIKDPTKMIRERDHPTPDPEIVPSKIMHNPFFESLRKSYDLRVLETYSI